MGGAANRSEPKTSRGREIVSESDWCKHCGRFLLFPPCNCKPYKVWAPDLDGADGPDDASTFYAASAEEAAEKYLEDSNSGDFSESADVFVESSNQGEESIRTKWHVIAEPTVNYRAREVQL